MDRAFTGTAYGKTNAADCFRFVAGQTLAQRLYQYDTSGNISQIESDLGITDYGYDKLDRLTEATPDTALQALGLPQEQYGYDPVGNRTSSAHQPGFWRYNADNQLTEYPSLKPFSLGALPVDTDVSYTPHGHTEKETNRLGTKEYGYNAAERLIRFANTLQGQTTPQLEAQYRYDPFGRRIAKTITQGTQTSTVWFIYSEQGLLAEANAEGELTKAYGFNPVTTQQGLWSTDPIWQANITSNQLDHEHTTYHYLHTDHLYTPMLATDATGDISWKAVQEAFGAINALQHQSRISMNLRFPGQYYDQETGTHYNFHRDYKPNAGRYVQSDPIGLNGGVNTYSYVGSSPVFSSDPYGLKEVTGEWIKDPKLNVVDYGFSGFELVSPSWSWWGYVQFIRLHGYANGFVNIDVLCKEINDCGESTWEIHNKIYFSAVGHKDFGPNAYILGVGLVTNFFVGVSLNILLGGYAILQAGADALSNLNDQALQVLRVAYVNGPTAYCVGG